MRPTFNINHFGDKNQCTRKRFTQEPQGKCHGYEIDTVNFVFKEGEPGVGGGHYEFYYLFFVAKRINA